MKRPDPLAKGTGLENSTMKFYNKSIVRTPKCAACGTKSSQAYCSRCLAQFPALRHLLPATPRSAA